VRQLANQVASGVPADKFTQATVCSSRTLPSIPWGSPFFMAVIQSLTPAQAALFSSLSPHHTCSHDMVSPTAPVADENRQQAANKAFSQGGAAVRVDMSGDRLALAGASSQVPGVPELQVCTTKVLGPRGIPELQICASKVLGPHRISQLANVQACSCIVIRLLIFITFVNQWDTFQLKGTTCSSLLKVQHVPHLCLKAYNL
jgi:hypothetical protein